MPTVAFAQEEASSGGLGGTIEAVFQKNIDVINVFFYFKIGGENGMPLIVLWLISGGIFFTLRMKFINIRAFKHAIEVVRGKYDDAEDEGDVSHFQALAAALSGTVGIGNIAGVAIAIRMGGPGAAFWMTVAGFLGMSSKFAECTLGQKFRIIKPDGTVGGGPMYYLSRGLSSIGMRGLGKGLGVIFALFCAIGTLGTGNMFQSNGDRTVNVYKVIFLTCVFIGSIINLDLVLEFSDILVLAMSLPNLLGCFLLSGVIARELDSYMSRLKSGEMLAEATEARESVFK